jgi:hypothetical protein
MSCIFQVNSFIMRPSPFVLDMRPSHNWCECDPEGQGFAWRIHGDFLAEKCWGAKGKLWNGAWKEWVRGRVGWGACAWAIEEVKVYHGGLMAAAAATLRALLR